MCSSDLDPGRPFFPKGDDLRNTSGCLFLECINGVYIWGYGEEGRGCGIEYKGYKGPLYE